MRAKVQSFYKLSIATVIFCIVMISSVVLYGQTESTTPLGVPDDWTHHHVVFSDPGTLSQAVVHGNLDRWMQITNDPRYKIQQVKRAMMQRGAPPPAFDFATLAARYSLQQQAPAKPAKKPVENSGIWSMLMGSPTATAASITNTIASEPTSGGTLTITNGANQLILTAGATVSTSCGTSSPYSWTFVRSGTASTDAANIVSGITTCGSHVGVTATNPSPPSATITITATTAGAAGNSIIVLATTNFEILDWASATFLVGGSPVYTPDIFPAKFSVNTNTAAGNCDSASTPDYVVYPTGFTGSSSQPNIIAYDNIYSDCSTSVAPFPNVYWQFNTGGLVTTSPVLSLNGKEVAFVQLSGGAAQLVLLKWNEDSSLQSPAVESSGTAYATCTAPCYYAITFDSTIKNKGGTPGSTAASTPTDTHSSPYYDYPSDTLYVGDDNGYLHKFTPVFNGTSSSGPAEITTTWPFQIATAPMNSPVFDGNSQTVYVGGAAYSSNSSAYYHNVVVSGTPATNAFKSSMAATGTDLYPMFYDGALLDPTTAMLYVAVNDDGTATPSAAVWQIQEAGFPCASASACAPYLNEAKVGNGASAVGDPAYSGTFDNIYISSSPSAGNLYVCGRDSGSQDPALWKVNINGTTLTATEMEALTTAAAQCSPVTEFDNGATDYIFLSVQANSQTLAPVSCPSNATGCLMSFNVTTALTGSTATTKTTSEAGGTSGVIVDNASTTTGNSQIYFFPLGSTTCLGNSNASAGKGTGICAFQLSQSGLQ
jgi:hypothetical protein